MISFSPLGEDFYNRPVQQVARELLGCRLVRRLDGSLLAGEIIETEAYDGEQDLACHARAGRTARTAVMYGPPGRAYVYFTYGMHWCLNAVCGSEGYPAAVLIRALRPVMGQEIIAARRAGVRPRDWLSGPARLTRAWGVDGKLNGASLLAPTELWIESREFPPIGGILCGPRIGIPNVPEPWRSQPWRYWLSQD